MAHSPQENVQNVARELHLEQMNPLQLLRASAAITDELRNRGIVRSKNKPLADYTEWLVATKLDFSLESQSSAGFDAVDTKGIRYQIKARRITPDNKSTQLGALRNLDSDPFDYLIAVIFEADFTINYAAKIPIKIVRELASYRKHVNAHILHLRTSALTQPDIQDITEMLKA